MLTLAAVAVFPLAGVSYAVVHSEVGGVQSGIAFETRDAALAAQARFAQLLDRRELAAVAAASSSTLRTAIRRHEHGALREFARSRGLVLDVLGRRYGRPVPHAVRAAVQLVSGGRALGRVVAQVPLDGKTLTEIAPPVSHGVRLAFADLHRATGQGATLPLGNGAAVHAYLPARLEARRTGAAYRRVEEAGALGLLALMLLAFLLARPLLRSLRWTEARAGESRVDVLTGIPNRRALEETLATEIARATRFRHPLTVALLDLDHFKRTNDTHGHAAGDEVLRTVGRLLAASARRGDSVARLGGEEFVAVLPETDLEGARHLAERLRLEIARTPVGELRTSASCGVAAFLPGDDVGSLLAAADEALYEAKSSGRNRTALARRAASAAA